MFCEKCGKEMQENKCPECGYVKEVKTKINPAKFWWFWALILVVVISVGSSIWVVVDNFNNSGNAVVSSEKTRDKSSKKQKDEKDTETDPDIEDTSDDRDNDADEDKDNQEFEEITNISPNDYSTSELEALIEKQEVRVIDTMYTVQHDEYKSLYPDMLQAIIQNDSSVDIRDAVIAFVAWDENNLPVKIAGTYDYNGGTYIKRVNYDAINLTAGGTYGHNSGLEIDENNNIKTVKAIVVSYTTFENETWENPYYETWCELNEAKKLEG